jgi:hypothetical protein
MFWAVRRVPALCDLPWRVLRAKSRSEKEFAVGGDVGFVAPDSGQLDDAALEYRLRTFSVKTENERADPTAGTPSWSHQWRGGPTAAGASSSVTTRSRRQADSGAFHLVGDNSENMPLRAGLLNRRRKLLGDQLDDECHARLRPGPTPPHIARVDSGRARSTSY